MRQINRVCVVVVTIVMSAACGGGPPASTEGQTLDITFTSEPDPPKMGENTFETMVMSGGQPVTDAEVAVELYMPAMPSMNMAEMRSSIPLKHEGGGRYRGAGKVMMSGAWDATVSVKRGGQEIGNRKFSVTAK